MTDDRKVFAPEALGDGHVIRVGKGRPRTLAPPPPPPPLRTKARDAALIYAETRLSMWAKWAKEHRESIGYPTISTLYRAMQTSKVGIIRGGALPDPEVTDPTQPVVPVRYPNNADASATRCMRAPEIGDPAPAIIEVDGVVARLPGDLRTVILADYFTYGAIEERCKRTPWRRARYSQLLEAAKYAVFVALQAQSDPLEAT
jgi:hypothetical protein